MCFPHDFGFIPGAKGEDGDPLDVTIISEFTTFPECLICCRSVGCIEAEQLEGNRSKKVRKDRFIAVSELSLRFSTAKRSLNYRRKFLKIWKSFSSPIINEEGKKFTVIALSGPKKSNVPHQTVVAGQQNLIYNNKIDILWRSIQKKQVIK